MTSNIVNDLNVLLSDYQVLYQKLRGYHWNVTGPLFFGLHDHFETLYDSAALRVDELAERVATLGGRPVATLGEQLALSRLEEDRGVPGHREMVQNLISDFETVNALLRETAARASEQRDNGTMNLLEGIADAQEKEVWMLRAFLAD